jgi:hypothetical protein
MSIKGSRLSASKSAFTGEVEEQPGSADLPG